MAEIASYPGTLFMSAGGCHHHVAANVWSSRGGGRPPRNAAGLSSFEAIVDQASIEQVATHLAATGFDFERRDGSLAATDPWGSTIVFRT